MKLLLNGDQELANIDLQVDPDTNICKPVVEGLGYRISGPSAVMSLTKADDMDGLRLNLELPGVTAAAVILEKSDVKKMKGIMNKDAIKFMVKALM